METVTVDKIKEGQMEDAIRVFREKKRASAELLRRELGFNLERATEICDALVDRGDCARIDGKLRVVLSQTSATLEIKGDGEQAPAAIQLPAGEYAQLGPCIGPDASRGTLIEKFEAEREAWGKVTSGLHLIPIYLVRESDLNARTVFDDVELRGLAESIRENGGVNKEAAQVRPVVSEGHLFEMHSGHRRLRALKLIGATHIKAEIVIPDAHDVRRESLLLNLQRVDLNPIEKADAFAKEMEIGRYTSVESMAKKMGMSEHARSIRDLLSLQKLFPGARLALIEKRISTGHAVLVARELTEDQPRVLEACFRPESRDNGGGMEMVSVLISEKQLRDWIKDNLRAEAVEQPRLFGTEEEKKDAAQGEELERKADAILEGDNQAPGVGSSEADDAEGTDGTSDANAVSDGDLDADDLSPAQAAAVKPEEGAEYEKEEARRVALLGGLVKRTTASLPKTVLLPLALELSRCNRDDVRTEKIKKLMSWPGAKNYDDVRDTIAACDVGDLHKIIVAYTFITATFPNYGSEALERAASTDDNNGGSVHERPAEKRSGKATKRSEPSVEAPAVKISEKEIRDAIEMALTHMAGAAKRWGYRSNNGMNTADLRSEIKRELGTGGSSTSDGLVVSWVPSAIRLNRGNTNVVIKGAQIEAWARDIFDVEALPEKSKAAKVKLVDIIAKNKAKAKAVKPAKKKAGKR